MSEGWKVAGIFFGVIGAAAIIFQLNQGTLVASVTSFLQGAVGDAFTSSSSSTPAPASSTGTNTSQSAAKNHSTHQQTVLV
jgi:hypothetical protein